MSTFIFCKKLFSPAFNLVKFLANDKQETCLSDKWLWRKNG